MTKQTTLVHNLDWDILIVIDACRYDYFAKYYREVFDNGKLIKVKSPSKWTFGWICDTFGNKVWKDIVCLKYWDGKFVLTDDEKTSSLLKITDIIKKLKYQKYAPNKFFGKNIRMPRANGHSFLYPDTATKVAKEKIKKYNNKKIIIFYKQLHEPHVYWTKEEKKYDVEQKMWRNNKFAKIYRFFYINLIQYFFSYEKIWTIKNKLGMQPYGPTGRIWLKYGWEGVRKGYIEDLKLLLKLIKELTETYPNKVFAVTSDHGELLGEHGRYGHETNKTYKEVAEVPWFVINDKN